MRFDLSRALESPRGRDDPADEARELRRRHPEWSEEDVVRALVRRTGIRCAAVAALASVPVPEFAKPAGGADFTYQSLALSSLAGRIAGAYERSPTFLERTACAAAGLVLAGSVGAIRRALSGALERPLRSRVPGPVVAALAAVAGGALAFTSVLWLGGRLSEFYRTGRSGHPRPPDR